MTHGDENPAAPAWLAAGTWLAMASARDSALGRGLSYGAVAEAVRNILLARHPALPACLISEAAEALVPPRRWRRLPRRAPRLPPAPTRP